MSTTTINPHADSPQRMNPPEVCPTWCTDRDQSGGCDGMHWTAGDGVVPTLGRIDHPAAVEILSVYLHQDREWVGLDRDPDEMDVEPHVLLHVLGAGGALDSDARMTADEARQLARLLMAAAADLDGDADTSGVTVTDIDRAARALGLRCSDLLRLAEGVGASDTA